MHKPKLRKPIDIRSVETHLPATLTTYEQGAIQTFGRLKISRMGLSDGHEWMPWNEFRHIGIFEGVLTIDRQGLRRPWVTTSLAQVPNAYLLIALVSKIPRNIR